MRSNIEVWFLEDDDGSSVQEFRFDAHNYGRAANWVLRDVLDNACGDAWCCDNAGGSTCAPPSSTVWPVYTNKTVYDDHFSL